MKSTAAELNTFLAAFKALELGAPFGAKFAGVDAITGTRFSPGTSIRMLCGKPLLTRPYLGGSGVEILSLCHNLDGTFVDDVDADGIYYTANARGEAQGFRMAAGQVSFAGLGFTTSKRSIAAFRAQRLRHQIALIKTNLTEVRL